MSESPGLFINRTGVPLQHVEARTRISECIAHTQLQQTYVVAAAANLEARYVFPLNDLSVINQFEVDIEHFMAESQSWTLHERLTGTVKNKTAARETYEDAVVENRSSSFLLEKHEDPNLFIVQFVIRSASVPAVSAQRLTLRIGIITETRATAWIPSQDSQQTILPTSYNDVWNLFELPVTVTPRTEGYVGVPDSIAIVATVPYKFLASIEFDNSSIIQDIQCPSHAVDISKSKPRTVTFRDAKSVVMDRSLRVYFRTEQLISNANITNSLFRSKSAKMSPINALLEKVPDGPASEGLHQYALALPICAPSTYEEEEGTEIINTELIFMVDCSGSMDGKPIRDAVRALKLFLSCLPHGQGLRFNILRFGSTHETLFSVSNVLTKETLSDALRYADKTSANLGGTVLLAPLKKVMQEETPTVNGSYTRQIFVLTDGEVDEMDKVLQMARSYQHVARIWTLGIGTSVSRKLVRGLAEATGGSSEFISGNEKIEEKVMGQLSKSLQPALTSVTINWGDLTRNKKSGFTPCFSKLRPVYFGSSQLVFVLFDTMKSYEPEIVLEAKTPNGKILKRKYALDVMTASRGLVLHTMAASALVREMDKYRDADAFGIASQQELSKTIADLSVKYQIVSSESSFVAVSKHFAQGSADAPLDSIVVPSPTVTAAKPAYAYQPAQYSGSYGLFADDDDCDFGCDLFDGDGDCSGFSFPSSSNRSAPAYAAAAAAAAAPASYKKEERKEEEDEGDMGFGLFGDDEPAAAYAAPTFEKAVVTAKPPAGGYAFKADTPAISLDKILLAQDVQGFWEWKNDLLALAKACLGVALFSELEKLYTATKSKDAFATTVAIILLPLKYPSDIVTMSLFVKKAKLYLKKQGEAPKLEAAVRAIFDKL